VSAKVSCTVLRGGESGDARTLPDVFSSYAAAREFARQAGAVIGYGVCCRSHPEVQVGCVTYHTPWSCSVPCAAPGRVLSLGAASRGSRAVIHA
jgi:hypothetical protein